MTAALGIVAFCTCLVLGLSMTGGTAAAGGVDIAGMDRSVKPGDDFFAYANGTWAKRTEIPPDRSSYGVSAILVEEATRRSRGLMEGAASNPATGSDDRKIGDYYAAYMDEASIEAKGVGVLKGELDRVAAISDRRMLAEALGRTLRADVDPLNNTNFHTEHLFGLWVAQDFNEPTRNAPYLLQGGLGMPDREYYLDESPRMAAIRTTYRSHIAAVLKLAGVSDPEAKAGRIFQLETAIAKSHWKREDSEQVQGLFQRAIVESGGSSVGGGGIAIRSRTLADSEADGRKFAESKGAPSLKQLRALSWQQLTAGSSARFAPIVDGYVLPAPVREITRQGKQNDVPMLTGANVGELGGLMASQAAVTLDSYVKRARQQYGPRADEFLKLYPAANDAEAAAAQMQSSRDQALVSMYLWAKERAGTARTKTFIYLWDHVLPGPDAARFGAFHTSEVPYVLNTLYMSNRPFTDADHRIADMMSSYWANFAAGGDPNGQGLATWAPVGDKPEVMELGDANGPVPLAGDSVKFRFVENFLTSPGP